MTSKLPNFYKSPHVLAGMLPDSAVMIGLSGGADSSCLLRLLCLEREQHFFPLYAAHVNHGIRTEEYGNEADRDEEFCRELCKQLNVELFVCRADVPLLSKNEGTSLETAARDVRYAFFAETMLKHNIPILVTAHNADDNLETQIFNLCRGCGLSGICGIPESRPFSEARGTIVRPILSGTKSDILEYCRQYGIPYVTDSTNLENDCTRNRIRNIVIPELNSLFSQPQRSALRLSRSAKEDLEFISAEAEAFLKQDRSIDTDKLIALHPSVAKRAITLAFEQKSGVLPEEIHINSVLELARSKKDGCIALPKSFWAIIENGNLRFENEIPQKKQQEPYTIRLRSGMNVIPNTPFAILLSDGDNNAYEDSNYKPFAKAKLCHISNGELFARNRREGDEILSGGMHKKLKKLMCDNKIPREIRDSLPLICLGEDIIFAPGCTVCDSFAQKNQNFDLCISVYIKI